jgi:methyl-accepting chemotaxis protein
VECTIFHHDTRVSTTIFRDGKRAIGTKMDNPKVIETVLNKGQRFHNVNQILGKDYNTAYWPLIDAGNKTCGMFFIGKARDTIEQIQGSIVRSILITVVVVGTTMLILGFFMSRSITRPLTRIITSLRDGDNKVSSSSSQVAAASQQLAEGSSEQAASLEETSSSLEEMSSMTKQNADNANQANALMNETYRVVEQANDSMSELTMSMQEIAAASDETAKIVKTIDEIAFQTNLLALNAAVEAARAGEAGAGFAVVADEVRNLAMRAAEAAKNTANLIEGTVAKVKAGSELVHKTGEAFTRVAASTNKAKELVGEIAAASQEQAQGVDQISKAVAEMDQVVQQNAANAEESASASEELSAQAEQVKGVVGELVALVGGNHQGGNGQAKRGRSRYQPEGETSRAEKTLTLATRGKKTKTASQGHGVRRQEPGVPRVVTSKQVIPLEEGDFNNF